jgi:hypothetical protein
MKRVLTLKLKVRNRQQEKHIFEKAMGQNTVPHIYSHLTLISAADLSIFKTP